MLKTGDKIKYVNRNSIIDIPLGTTFTVTDVTVQAIYMEAKMELCGMTGIAKCVMSYNEYEKYFEKVVEEPKHIWTEWRKINEEELHTILHGLDEDYYITKYLKHYLKENGICIETRNNRKKTDVRVKWGEFCLKSTSTCNKSFDKFNESTGIEVALIKLFVKILTHYSDIYIRTTY